MGEKEVRVALIAPADQIPMRVDLFVAQNAPQFKRSVSRDKRTRFLINKIEVKKSKNVVPHDHVEAFWWVAEETEPTGQIVPLNIIWQDDSVLVLNKQQGVVVHPGNGNPRGTLLNGLIYRYGPSFFGTGESQRNGIVHRLDKETSGVMVVAKDLRSQQNLAHQFKARKTEKHYIALVKGTPLLSKGVVDAPIARDKVHRRRFTVSAEGRASFSEYQVLRRFNGFSLLRLNLVTGRTHQLRVHLKHIGLPIIGDALYCRDSKNPLMLHALSLSFTHPVSGERLTFKAPLPSRFKDYITSQSHIGRD